MVNYQTGATSSQLSPQAFKNSSQSGTLQGAKSFSGAQQSASSSTLTSTSTNYQLQVIDSSSNLKVLGVASTTQNTDSQPQPIATQSNNIFFPTLILAGSLALGIYFYKKYVKLSDKTEN